MLFLLAQADPSSAAAKAATDLLAAQDTATMWRALAVLAAAGCVFFFMKWQAAEKADKDRLAALLATYQTAAGPGPQKGVAA